MPGVGNRGIFFGAMDENPLGAIPPAAMVGLDSRVGDSAVGIVDIPSVGAAAERPNVLNG